MTRQALIVLGMHRSGTSALTGLLQRLGVQGPNTPIPADEHNPLGYGESNTIASFHERLLDSSGSRWDAWVRVSPDWFESPVAVRFLDECRSLLAHEFGDKPLFVVKDPRLCRFLPFWLRVLQAENVVPAAIIPIRSPLAVARSLETRDRLPREHSLLMWLRHVLEAEFETRNISRSIVRYRDLLSDWKAVANRLSADLHVTWPDQSRAAETDISDFVRPELCHHAVEIESMDVVFPLSDWLRRTYEAFDVLLDPGEHRTAEACATLDEVRHEFDRAASIFGPIIEAGRSLAADLEGQHNVLRQYASNVETEREHLRERVSRLESERDALQKHASGLEQLASSLKQHVFGLTEHVSSLEHRNEVVSRELASAKHHVEALLESASWRITAPLRAAARVFKGNAKARSTRARRG